jgi:ATP-dependent RNA helicase DHX57
MPLKSPFVAPMDKRAAADAARARFAVGAGNSDHITISRAFDEWLAAGPRESDRRKWCDANFVSHNTMSEIAGTRAHFAELLASVRFVTPKVTRRAVESAQRNGRAEILDARCHAHDPSNRIVCAGLYPNVVKVINPAATYHEVGSGTLRDDVESRELKFRIEGGSRCFVHPASVNFSQGEFKSPWLVYCEKMETTKVYIRDSTEVSPYALLLFGGPIAVDHGSGTVTVGGFVRLRAPGRVAVLAREVREALDELLDAKVRDPRTDMSGGIAEAVARLLEGNGHA